MNWGNTTLLAGTTLRDMEDIFVDDVQDGMASMADEMASAWMQEFKELQECGKGASEERMVFLQALIQLCDKVTNIKASKRNGKQHGKMGSTSRLQPRTANTRFYDALTREATLRDVKLSQVACGLESYTKALDIIKQDEAASAHAPTMDLSTFAKHINHAYVTKFGATSTTTTVEEKQGPADEPSVPEIILKIGSNLTHAGFGGDDAPRAVFPSIVGRCKHPGIMVGMDQKDAYVGDEAQSKRGVLTLKYPIESGQISNFDDFTKVLHHVFYNELRVAPEDHPVCVLTNPTTVSQLSSMIRILFEEFHVPLLKIGTEQVMSLLASGKEHGIVVDFGLKQVRIAVIVKGSIVDGSLVNLAIGGADITAYQMKVLSEKGYSFTTTAERDIVNDLKEKLGFAAANITESLNQHAQTFNKTYELPDGQSLAIDQERFRINEPWFSPAILGKTNCLSLQNGILVSLSRVPAAFRSTLLSNIVMSGGPSTTPGLGERLEMELQQLLPNALKTSVAIASCHEAKYLSFIGASLLSQLQGDHGQLSRADYDAYGPDDCATWLQAHLFSKETEASTVPAPSTAASLAAPALPPVLPASSESKESGEAKDEKVSIVKETKEVQEVQEVQEAKQAKQAKPHSQIAASKPLSNTNVLLVKSSTLISKAINSQQSMENLPVQCCHCPAFFTAQCTFKIDEQKDTGWSCAFCGTKQAAHSPPSVPAMAITRRPQELDFVPDISMTKQQESKANDRLVVFCVDTSGSMGATTEMPEPIELFTGFNSKTKIQHVSRLDFVKTAIRSKILQLKRTEPNAIPIIVTFGSTVRVNLPDGTTAVIEGKKTLEATNTLLSKGSEIVQQFTNTCGGTSNGMRSSMRSSMRSILTQLHAVSVSGCTALGPALATSVGMCSQMSGSQIVVATDGVANIGVGALNSEGQDPQGFYSKIGIAAKATGTSISILTLEGCRAGMETLGTAADLTSGRVTIVDPQDLTSSFSDLGSDLVVGTNVQLKVLAGNGATITSNIHSNDTATTTLGCVANMEIGNAVSGGSQNSFTLMLNDVNIHVTNGTGGVPEEEEEENECFRCPISLEVMTDPVIMTDGFSYERIEAEDWLSRGNTTSPLTNKKLASTKLIPNQTLRQSIEEYQDKKLKKSVANNGNDDGREETQSLVPVQVQLNYMDSAKVLHLRLFTIVRECTFARSMELDCDSSIISIAALHEAAGLAQQGFYEKARIELISTQRLLQRSMTLKSQKTYMAFVVLAEKLDNWIREALVQEKLLNSTGSKKNKRDDDASSAMYQMKRLSIDDFESTVSSLVA